MGKNGNVYVSPNFFTMTTAIAHFKIAMNLHLRALHIGNTAYRHQKGNLDDDKKRKNGMKRRAGNEYK